MRLKRYAAGALCWLMAMTSPAGAQQATEGGERDGVRLLRPETVVQMRTWLFADLSDASDMAHGFQALPLSGTMVFGHAGGLNEFISNLVFIPQIGAGVFISQNGGAGASLPFLGPDLILAHLAAKAGLTDAPAQPVPDASARAAEVAGRYIADRRTLAGPLQALAPQIPVQALPDGAILAYSNRLGALVRYDPIAPDLWQEPHGERVMAIRDASGQAVRLMDGMGVTTYERVRLANDPMLALAGLGLSALLALSTLVLVWRAGGWSLWRRLHHTGFALALAATGALFMHWGLAFGGMG